MTILPHDVYFGRWMRAKAYARFLVDKLRACYASVGVALPPNWGEHLEIAFTENKRRADEELRRTRSPK